VISYGLWSRRYGLDPQITSRRLIIQGRRVNIVGVMPKSFTSAPIDVWLPAQVNVILMRQRGARFLSGVGRMQPGITPRQAQADLASVEKGLGELHPHTDRDWSALVKDLKENRVGDSRKQLVLLFGAVGLLLITVSKVAGLVLAQLREREREIVIRASLGAARAQVVGTVMREIACLAMAAAVGGYAMRAGRSVLLAKLFADTPRVTELAVDRRALGFAMAASFVGAAAFGLLAALRATRNRSAGSLIRAGRGVAGERQWAQSVLIGGHVALAMLLLTGGLGRGSRHAGSHAGATPGRVSAVARRASRWDHRLSAGEGRDATQ